MLMLIGKQQIDPRLLAVENFRHIQSASEGIALLKHAVDIVKNEEYIAAALEVIIRLASGKSKTVAAQLGDGGICSILDGLLGQKMQVIELCKLCIQAIATLITVTETEVDMRQPHSLSNRRSSELLSTSEEAKSPEKMSKPVVDDVSANRKRLANSAVLFRLIKACHIHCADSPTLVIGLKVLLIFAKDAGEAAKLVSCGVCDILSQAIRIHAQQEDITTLVCQCADAVILHDLDECDGSLGCQDKLSDNFMCEVLSGNILQAKLHPSLLTTCWALRLLGSLARRNSALKDRLASCGICELVPPLCSAEFMANIDFAESLCWCIASLSFPHEDNQTKLGASGACMIIVKLLNIHSKDVMLVQEACRALHQLGEQHDANLALLVATDAPSLCMQLLKKYDARHDVLHWVMYALATLAQSSEAQAKLNADGICAEVVALMHRS
jgi:hypothetical protein